MKSTVVRAGKKGKQINLDDCYMQYDVMDTDGQLMDLSLCNPRSRVSDILLRKFFFVWKFIHSRESTVNKNRVNYFKRTRSQKGLRGSSSINHWLLSVY